MNNTFYPVNDYRTYLSHIGNANSGRYRRGSGKNPFQHAKDKARAQWSKRGEYLTQDIKSGKDKAPVSRAEKVTREISKISDETTSAVGRMGNMHRRGKINKATKSTGKMSDAELNAAIKRMRLEQEYNRLSTSDIRSGFDVAQDILAIGGSVAGIAASAATIASIFYGIKHPVQKE